jgi:hypothetical protein
MNGDTILSICNQTNESYHIVRRVLADHGFVRRSLKDKPTQSNPAVVYQRFEPWSFYKTLATLLLLEKQGYHIRVDTEKERVTFTHFPL